MSTKESLHAVLAVAVLGAALARSVNAEVSIEGLDEPLLTNVLALLSIDDEPCDSPGWRIEQAYEDASEGIRAAMEAFGYYTPTIDSTLSFSDECWSAHYVVSPGDPVRLRSVSVELVGEAQTDPSFSRLLDRSPLRVGEPLRHGEYEQLKSDMIALSDARGYVDAKFDTSRIDVFPDTYAADVALVFDSGPRYRFGSIELDQNLLEDQLVLDYLSFKPGDYYDAGAVTSSQIGLANTGFFASVIVSPMAPLPETKEVPVVVSLRPAPRKYLSYGVGVSTDTGVRVRFGRTIRPFNERGHQLTFSSQLSPVISEVTTVYRLPYGDPRSEWLSFDVGVKREYTETAQSRSFQLGARRVQQRGGDWMRTELINYLVEDYDVAGEPGRSRLLMPGMEWSRLRSDSSVRPRNGSKIDFELRAAADNLGSDTSFAQFVSKAKKIWGIGRASRVLVRGELGTTWANEFGNLPPSIRFFAGGDDSVRGYDFETLGPVDEDGEVIGGPHMVTASIEYEHPVKGNWSVAVFTDAGNAFDRSNVDVYSGAGFGARWQSPLGPVRVDIAKPLDGPDRDWRLHISLGPDL